jgi:YjbE family integral membrane protein
METLLLFLQILMVNVVLSGDNALVIAMASRSLPERQRKAAVWWGATGAVALRVILTWLAVLVLSVPYVRGAGALLLLYISVKLLSDEGKPSDDDAADKVRPASGLLSAVKTILIADFVMSLDNVLAVAAIARDRTELLVAGIAMSIPIVIWGSSLIAAALKKLPVLVYAGAAVLGYTAGELLVHEPMLIRWLTRAHSSYEWVVPLMCALVAVVGGRIAKGRR